MRGFCRRCGAMLRFDDGFCNHCGPQTPRKMDIPERSCVVCGTTQDLVPGGYKCEPCEAQYPTAPIPSLCVWCKKNPVDLGVDALCDECHEHREQAVEAWHRLNERRLAVERGEV